MAHDDADERRSTSGRHISLIGMAGTGKTSVGRALARRRHLRFVDLDREIEASEGVTIGELFDRQGEGYFRRCEHDVLVDVVEREPRQVISTGGGVVVTADNRSLLAEGSRCVWLRADIDTLTERLTASRVRRPLLDGDVRANLAGLLVEREAWYAGLADVVCDVDGRSIAAIVSDLDRRVG